MGALKRLFAKLAGKTAKAKAEVEGNVGVLSTIAGDHAEIEALMDGVTGAIASSDPRSLDTRRRLFRKLRVALLAHQLAERREVYQILDKSKLEHARMVAAGKEHDEIESRLAQLQRMAVDDPLWASEFAELVAAVQCHHDLEEHEVFSEARELLSAEELVAIDARFQAAHERALASLSGRARSRSTITRRIAASRAS